jgi:molecular chaperone Hsp31 and glyoxalase 3
MAMANGKKFSTGNHLVEMTLPILQILSAGFEIDVITPTGAASRSKCGRCLIKTPYVTGLLHTFETAFKTSKSLAHFADKP